MNTVSLRVNERAVAGKGAARAERRAGFIPGVIYGEKKPPVMISISARELDAQMRSRRFWTTQFEIEAGKNKCHAICQDVQLDPVTDVPVHVDFLRVSADTELEMEVPVELINETECPGLKLGGTLNMIFRTIIVLCKPKDIPENLIVDLTGLEIGDVVKMSNISFPKGVKPVEEEDLTVLAIAAPTVATAEETTDAAAESGDADASDKE